LGISIRENAGDIRIDPNQFLADTLRAVNSPERLLEFITSDRVLKLRQRLPIRRIGEGIAEAVGGADGGEAEEEDKEDPERRRAKDHGLDFRLFNTMLARC
jgi:hypothetical protein